MPRNRLHVAEPVGRKGDLFVFVTGERPKLASLESIPVTYMVERIDVIIGDDILLSALAVEGEHHVRNFVTEHPISQMPVERKDRKIILVGLGRTLSNVERKQIESSPLRLFLGRAARPIEKLAQLPSV